MITVSTKSIQNNKLDDNKKGMKLKMSFAGVQESEAEY